MTLSPMPVEGLLGGLCIGCAAAALLLFDGRVAGVSGLAARVVGLGGDAPWALALAFTAGFPLGALLFSLANRPVLVRFPTGVGPLVAAGLLVGFGTRLGGGCTSGHGVCGLARLSPRSLAATTSFMATGFVTVAAWRAFGPSW